MVGVTNISLGEDQDLLNVHKKTLFTVAKTSRLVRGPLSQKRLIFIGGTLTNGAKLGN